MELLYLLVIIEILLLYTSWRVFERDLFSPFVLSILLFIPCTLLCIWAKDLWRMQLSSMTFGVMICGFFSMYLGGTFSLMYRKKPSPSHLLFCYSTSLTSLFIMSLTCILGTYLYYREMIQLIIAANIAETTGIGDAKDLLTSGEYTINPFIKQMYKVVIALAYICFFVISTNVINKKNKKHVTFYLIPIICGIIISVLAGNRIEIFKILSSFAFIFYILWQRAHGWNTKPNRLLLQYVIPIMFLFVIAFAGLRFITKSSGAAQDNINDIGEYTAYYAGSGLQVLNIKIGRGVERWRSSYFGGTMFPDFYSFFSDKGLIPEAKTKEGQMVYVGGDSNADGNVHTFFGRGYIDFNLPGMIISTFLIYFFFSRYYYRHIVGSVSSYKSNLRLLLYTWCYSNVIALSFYENNITAIFSQTGVLQLIVLWFLYVLIMKKIVRKELVTNPYFGNKK